MNHQEQISLLQANNDILIANNSLASMQINILNEISTNQRSQVEEMRYLSKNISDIRQNSEQSSKSLSELEERFVPIYKRK